MLCRLSCSSLQKRHLLDDCSLAHNELNDNNESDDSPPRMKRLKADDEPLCLETVHDKQSGKDLELLRAAAVPAADEVFAKTTWPSARAIMGEKHVEEAFACGFFVCSSPISLRVAPIAA